MYRNTGEKMEPYQEKEGEMYYPHLKFTIEQLPEIGMWQVGETYELKIKVKQISHEIEQEIDKQKECAQFEILAVEAYEVPLANREKIALDKLGMR